MIRIEDEDGFATEWEWPDDRSLLGHGDFVGLFEARHDALRQAAEGSERADVERKRLAGVVEAALEDWGDPVGGAPWSDVAEVAIAALVAEGVVCAHHGVSAQAEAPSSEGDRG